MKIKKFQEVEFKWQARSIHDFTLICLLAKKLGARFSRPKKIQIRDLYLDTRESFFERVHLVCRIRRYQKHSELTLKGFGTQDHGMFVRGESTLGLPPFPSKKTALLYCKDHFFKNRLLFENINYRQTYTLTLTDGTLAILSFDRFCLCKSKKRKRMQEIELEYKAGSPDQFKAFAAQVSSFLKPSPFSKFETGKNLSKNPSPSKLDTIGDLVNRILEKNVKSFKDSESLILSSTNSEAVHDMRVSIRRLKSALAIFHDVIPKNHHIREKLQKIFRILGKKRDLDIFAAFIQSSVQNSGDITQLTKALTTAQKRINALLQSKYYANVQKSLEELKAVDVPIKTNILQLSKEMIQKALNNVLQAAPSIRPDVKDKPLHRLRISIKKLRYTCEFFEPIFSKYICSLKAMIEKTKKMQDILGEHQDAITGMRLVKHFKECIPTKEFIQIKKNYRIRKGKMRTALFKSWNSFWVGGQFNRPAPKNLLELLFTTE